MVLGPLVVLRGGQPIADAAWRSRQDRRLLGALISARGVPVPSERLIAWLWPDTAPEAAAITLRSTVSSLRHTLEPERDARASARYILTRPGGYAWNMASDAWIDLEAFLAHLQAAYPPMPRSPTDPDLGSRPPDAEALGRAIALYRGDYLEDEPNAPWAVSLREMLRERFLAALTDLAELQLAAGEYEAARALARRGLEHDPLREPLYRVLMRAQALGGDVAGALQSYERYRHLLDQELGAMPSAQTQRLHAAILRGDVEASHAPRAARRSSLLRAPAPLRPNSALPPFVGRAPELAALRGWIDDLGRRRGGIVALVGEAGIGKTRLAEEALRYAAEGGALAIVLRCTFLERDLPFAPLSEALRPLLRAAPDALLRRLPAAALAQVADLLPVLRDRCPDLPALPDVPPPERRNRVLDGLVDLALALAHRAPLVVVCDDAQWADEATLAALGRVARHAPRRAMLVMLAYRSEELADNAALHALLRALGRELLLRPLVLGGLDAAQVAELLAGLARTSPDRLATLAERLAAASGGNPLFLNVAIQSLLEAHGAGSLAELVPRLDAGLALPDLAGAPQIRDLVLSRLERVPAPARALLEQLAVIGRPVSLDLIEQLAGPTGLEAAQTLLARQFLLEDADGRLAFAHDVVRATVVAALASPQRRLRHRQAAEAIAALAGERPERAAELAFHFGQLGRGADPEVLRYAIAAGDHARRSFGYHEAVKYYESALLAAERLDARAPTAEVWRAFRGRLLACEALLDWDGVMATAQRYERWAARRADAPELVTTRRLVLLRALMGDLAAAAALSAEHERRQPEALPAIRDMLRRTARILQPAEHPCRPPDPAVVASPRPFVPADPPPGAPADDLPALLGPDDAAMALFQVGWAVLMQGLLWAAEPCLVRAYDLACETGQASVAVISALQLAHLNALRGLPAATDHWLAISLDTAGRAPEAAWASIWPRIHQGFLWLLDDQFAAAQERFESLAAQLAGLPAFQSHRASVEVGLGLLALARGEREPAAAQLEAALASPQLLYGFVYVAALHGLAQVAARRGELCAARAALGHALDYSARRSLLPEYVRTAIEIARVERDCGDPAPTLPLLDAAAGLADAAGLVPLAAVASSLCSRLLS